MMLDKLRHFKANLLSVKHHFCIAVLELVPRTYKRGIRLTIANYLIRSAGIKSGRPVYLAKGFKVLNPRNISVGAYSVFGNDTHIWAYTKVTIGAYTLGAKDLLIIAGSHEINSLRPRPDQEVEIGPGCWIGARVTILGGVKIGRGAVIGACAVVNKDVPDYAVVAGNPARIIRYREAEEVQWNPFRSYKIEEIA